MNAKQRIYLDYAATTPIHPQALEDMVDACQRLTGNPSSLHQSGRSAAAALAAARERIAQGLEADSPDEIVFTSSGSEADSLAVIGFALANQQRGRHLITTGIEHHAVLHACKYLEQSGFEVSYLPVDEYGLVDPAALEKAMRADTILISIMQANNEIGTIQPIPALAAVAREHRIAFHTDAVQSLGQIPVSVRELGVDLLTLSAHKFYGPRGVGMLFVRDGIELTPLVHGGNQEHRRRAGTENLPGIIGSARAFELAVSGQTGEAKRLEDLRNELFSLIKQGIPDVRLNGHPSQRLPNNLNICFKDTEAEGLLLRLNLMGIDASMGSACTSESIEPSHVIQAIGVGPAWERGALRLSLGKYTTREEITAAANSIIDIIHN